MARTLRASCKQLVRPDVLVTGSSGHLGHALMLELPKHGFQPLGLDRLPLEKGILSLTGSVADRGLVSRVFKKYTSIRYVIHSAALHKPHVPTHGKQAFIDTNLTGTLNVLEEAVKHSVEAFVFASTTNTFGSAVAYAAGAPSAWLNEETACKPNNIYGATKLAAENLCQLVHMESGMPTLILRTARFFPGEDDDPRWRTEYNGISQNLKVNELLYRRVDIADVVTAYVQALKKAKVVGFSKYVVSAPPPFQPSGRLLAQLGRDAAPALAELLPEYVESLRSVGWKLPARLDRVCDSSKAMRELDWRPVHTFQHAVLAVSQGRGWNSELARNVGERRYH
ncbi:hypothetical protein CKM354_000267200 [Cercospora kikuchii]|uniref:NAD-dependent epimerase/dehydratase domain-containing protein n=1 Tax=Cercospora kikuchii TaxID=84275 RepID=A0A9P3CIQ3_9PEZI|nr:uncharacterized protein CKM354_000267200 [Cercospora kikuchii]GIZ39283.1 hypothetical protein CKM354_000267200 [Cercospora kikuchii]